jgi:hypothetical protein
MKFATRFSFSVVLVLVLVVPFLNGQQATFPPGVYTASGASFESAWTWVDYGAHVHYGLQLQGAGKSPFGYQQPFAYLISAGPNACDFAGYSSDNGYVPGTYLSSIAYVFVGSVPTHQTLTVTLSYHAL